MTNDAKDEPIVCIGCGNIVDDDYECRTSTCLVVVSRERMEAMRKVVAMLLEAGFSVDPSRINGEVLGLDKPLTLNEVGEREAMLEFSVLFTPEDRARSGSRKLVLSSCDRSATGAVGRLVQARVDIVGR